MTKKNEDKREINLKKYILIFLITLTIFLIGFYFSNVLVQKRYLNIKDMEDRMATNILSSEIQFELLEDASCKGINEKTTLSQELKELAKKLSFMEKTLGIDNLEVKKLKEKYTLLQIKDILLMKKISKKCNLKPINILYFYSNKKDSCDDCKKQGYVLTRLSQDNPRLRIYSFDYDLDSPALKTLIQIKNVINKKLPVLVIKDRVYSGFQSIEKIKKLLPKLELIEKKYLLNSDGSDSNIQIQCAEDSQCVLAKNLNYKCGFPVAISILNEEKVIGEYNKSEEKWNKKNDSNCNLLKEYINEVYCSKDNICKVKEK